MPLQSADSRGRQKRLALNTSTSLILQLTTILCGFVLPKITLSYFGSEVNGLVRSIQQFLQIIAFLELGIGQVVKSSLYKPLAEGDRLQVSRIITSAGKFFKRLAMILAAYIAFLIVAYPFFAHQDFGWLYTAGLIAAMGISSFAQYYFGIVDTLLLTADQKGYIQYTTQTFVLIANTIACVVLVKLGAGEHPAGIHMVKLTTSIIYLLRPLLVRLYVNKYYKLNRKEQYDEEPIKQKWNGIAQHVSAVVLDATDNIVLTIFSTLSNVSIYSVYNLVVNGVKTLFTSMTHGAVALLGDMWARKEEEALRKFFSQLEWVMHTGVVFVFGCTLVLIVPFVKVYTKNITDADYIQPLFGVLLTLSQAGHCLRLPYNSMILAGGHYKQTQSNYIIAAVMNIVISIVTVTFWGLIGVAIGTLVAMVYQTIWMAWYISRHLNHWPFRNFVRQVVVDAVTVGLGVLATVWIPLVKVTYFWWVVLAAEVALCWLAIIAVINLIFYREHTLRLLKTLPAKLLKKLKR